MATRILQIIPTLVQGGAEKQLTLLATGLEKGRYDVHVCALTSAGPYADVLGDSRIPVHVVGKSWKIDPGAYWRLKRHIRAVQPDIVQTWIFAANCYGRQAAISCRVPRIVAAERCVDRWKLPYQFAIDRHLAQRSDALVAPSEGVRQFYVGHGLPEDKFHVIHNGVTTATLPTSLTRDELLVELDLPQHTRLIGAVGRLWPQKRWKDAIWAAELLSVVRDDVHLLILGEGPQRWRLERFAKQVHLRGKIHFLGHRDDALKMLPHFDCLWLSSSYEGLPNSILEAMVAGVPVVATDIPGNRDLVISHETGYLVPVGDRAAFARQTLQLLEDESLRKEMGNAAKRRVADHFSVDKMIRRYDEFYQQLI